MMRDSSRHIHHVPVNGGPCIAYSGQVMNITELGSQKELNPPLMIEIARKFGTTILPPKPGG